MRNPKKREVLQLWIDGTHYQGLPRSSTATKEELQKSPRMEGIKGNAGRAVGLDTSRQNTCKNRKRLSVRTTDSGRNTFDALVEVVQEIVEITVGSSAAKSVRPIQMKGVAAASGSAA